MGSIFYDSHNITINSVSTQTFKNEMIVTCKFLGRLANNIIQVMAVIGYAKKNNIQWCIPRQYHHKDIFRFGLPLQRGSSRFPEYRDKWSEEIGYEEIPSYHRNGVCLVGFFQSEKYFAHAKNEIFYEFRRLNSSNILRDQFSETCSIHIRRGDYLEYPTRFHCVSLDYIGNAIDIMKAKGYRNFRVFSDDIQWCKDNFKFSGNFTFSENKDAVHDLEEMTCCSSQIICASTFGWVAGWLNRNENKTIIAPKKWFEWETKLTDKDIIPGSWTKI